MHNWWIQIKQNIYKKILTLLCILFIFSLIGLIGPIRKSQLGNEEKVWSNAGFVNPNIEYIDVDKFYEKSQDVFTHSLDLTLVMFRRTGWHKKMILPRLRKLADIYAQCGIRLGQVKFVETGAPGDLIDFSRPGAGDVEIAQRVPPTFKPILFYFRSIPKFNAYAWPENTDNEDVAGALKNTAWFSLSVAMKLNIKIRHPNYVSEAHEVGHILLDSLEHTDIGVANLMAGRFEYENGEITSGQCTKIKEHPLVKPINAPLK